MGHYENWNLDGVWTKCNDMWVGPTESDKFLEAKDFLVDSAAPMSLVVRVAIEIGGRYISVMKLLFYIVFIITHAL